MNNKNCAKEEPKYGGTLPAAETPTQTGKEIRVPYFNEPPTTRPDRTINERYYIPLVPEGEQVPDNNPSPPVNI